VLDLAEKCTVATQKRRSAAKSVPTFVPRKGILIFFFLEPKQTVTQTQQHRTMARQLRLTAGLIARLAAGESVQGVVQALRVDQVPNKTPTLFRYLVVVSTPT
jgi:hypothetical protein